MSVMNLGLHCLYAQRGSQLTRLLFRHPFVIYLDKYRRADLKQQSKSQRFRTKEKVKSKNCNIYNQAENTSLLIFCSLWQGSLLGLRLKCRKMKCYFTDIL